MIAVHPDLPRCLAELKAGVKARLEAERQAALREQQDCAARNLCYLQSAISRWLPAELRSVVKVADLDSFGGNTDLATAVVQFAGHATISVTFRRLASGTWFPDCDRGSGEGALAWTTRGRVFNELGAALVHAEILPGEEDVPF